MLLKKQAMTFLLIALQFGALAQLGARNIRIVEATGSNPVCSIEKRHYMAFFYFVNVFHLKL